ncbi:MAG: Cof-type HAD-IIB family hydrolase [Clostridiaceae bacterium]
MNYKLVCLDMDGTLLNDNKEVSDKNKEGIKRLIENNIKVAVSTGRPYVNAGYFADLIGQDLPIIASNGAYIYEKGRGVIYSKPLSKENAVNIIKTLKENGFYSQFHGPKDIYTEKLEYSSLLISKFNQIIPEKNRMKINILKNFDEILKNYNGEFLKCILINEDEKKILKVKEELKKLSGLEVVSSSKCNVEVMEKGISKGEAVESLAKYLGIGLNQVAVMGDNENDLSMIKRAGLGIAMGNAEDEVKSAAKYITGSNNEDGVFYAIDKFILS